MHTGKSGHCSRAGKSRNDICRSRRWCTTNGNHGVARLSQTLFSLLMKKCHFQCQKARVLWMLQPAVFLTRS